MFTLFQAGKIPKFQVFVKSKRKLPAAEILGNFVWDAGVKQDLFRFQRLGRIHMMEPLSVRIFQLNRSAIFVFLIEDKLRRDIANTF